MNSLEAGEECQTEHKEMHVHGHLGGKVCMEARRNQQGDTRQVRNAFLVAQGCPDAVPLLDGEDLEDGTGGF